MSHTLNFTLLSKNVLSPEEQEMYELATLAGVTLDPSVYKIILDLLKMNIAPTAVLQMLQSMCGQRRKKSVPNSDQAPVVQRSREDVDPARVRPSSKTRRSVTGRPEARR